MEDFTSKILGEEIYIILLGFYNHNGRGFLFLIHHTKMSDVEGHTSQKEEGFLRQHESDRFETYLQLSNIGVFHVFHVNRIC